MTVEGRGLLVGSGPTDVVGGLTGDTEVGTGSCPIRIVSSSR